MAQEASPTLLARLRGWFAGISKFFREVRAEYKRVQWPNRKELTTDTIVVLIYVAIVAVFLGLVDLGLSFLLNQIIRTTA